MAPGCRMSLAVEMARGRASTAKQRERGGKNWTYWWVNCVIDDKRAFPPQTGLIQKAQQALSKLKSSGPAPSCYHSSAAAADRSLNRMVSGSKVVLKACTPFPTWNVILFSHLVESGTDGGLQYGGYFRGGLEGAGGGGGEANADGLFIILMTVSVPVIHFQT